MHFFHAAKPEEEAADTADPLKKIRWMHNCIKRKCTELYHPLHELSIDEQMVKSKAHSHFRQYIQNKSTKWGFKYWIIADASGYTIDYDLYCGRHRANVISKHGLAYDVVMELVNSFQHQGYFIFLATFTLALHC